MGSNVIGQFTDEVEEITEKVVQDVKDSVGEAIEQGVQSVVGTPLTQQQMQQKQKEDQDKMIEARRKIAFWQKLDQEQKALRMKKKQEEMQKKQEESQEKQVKKVEQIEQKQAIKKPGVLSEEVLARSQMERSKGRGVGG